MKFTFAHSMEMQEIKVLLGKQVQQDDDDAVVCFIGELSNDVIGVSVEAQSYYVSGEENFSQNLQYLKCLKKDGIFESEEYIDLPFDPLQPKDMNEVAEQMAIMLNSLFNSHFGISN